MTCAEVEALILEGEPDSPAIAADARAHLGGCETCRDLADTYDRKFETRARSTLVGSTIGNYRIREQIGAGGTGVVYLAEHATIGTRVAIKVLGLLVSVNDADVQRLFNEARAVERVKHAGTVKIFDVGHHEGHPYLVMEYLDGESLTRRLHAEDKLTGGELFDIAQQLTSVLEAVHDAGITHRDIKPENIFLVRDQSSPSGQRLKLLDFGIAKLHGTLGNNSPHTHGTMGTPSYMAPEQWHDAGTVNAKADVYSLGCVVFELASGRPPFVSSSVGAACVNHLYKPPPRLCSLVPDAPVELDALLDQMLAKQPADRPTVGVVANALRSIERFEPVRLEPGWREATTESSSPRIEPVRTTPAAPPRSRRTKVVVAVVGAVVATGVGAAVWHSRAVGKAEMRVTRIDGENQVIPLGEWQQFGAQVVDRDGVPVPNVRVAWRTPKLGDLTYIDTTDEHGMTHATQLYSSDEEMDLEQTAAVAPDWRGSNWSDTAVPSEAPVVFHYRQARVHPQPSRASTRSTFEIENPWTTVGSLRVTSHQLSMREISLLAHVSASTTPEAPASGLTQIQAREFCAALGARLMTSEEWTLLAAGNGLLDIGGVASTLADWTSSLDGTKVIARGAAIAESPPFAATYEASDSSPKIGVRCVTSAQN